MTSREVARSSEEGAKALGFRRRGRLPSAKRKNERNCASARPQHEGILCRTRQERRGAAVCPVFVAGSVKRRQRVVALPARHVEIAVLLVTGFHGETFGGAERRTLHARHVAVARQA